MAALLSDAQILCHIRSRPFFPYEMAENLARRGLSVTLVELTNQVMPPLDPAMAAFVAKHLRANGIHLRLGHGVERFEQRANGGLRVHTSSGEPIDADLVILGIGVQPEATLAKDAGLELGERGGIRGDLPLAAWASLDTTPAQIVDVRSVAKYTRGHIRGAKNIPLEELRRRLPELAPHQDIWLVCGVGQRAYYATRILLQHDFRVSNLSGGMQTYDTFAAIQRAEA